MNREPGWRAVATAIGLAIKADPWRCVAAAIGTLTMSAQPVIVAMVVRSTANAIAAEEAGRATWLAVVLALTVAGQIPLLWLTFGLRTVLEEKVRHRIELRLAEASMAARDLRHHEDAATADEMSLVERDLSRLAAVIIFALTLAGAVAQLLVSVVVLGEVNPVLIALPLIGLIPVWAGKRGDAARQRALQGAAAGDRLATGLYEIACSPGHAEELATGGSDGGGGLRRRIRAVALGAQAVREKGEFAAARPVLFSSIMLGLAYAGTVLVVLLAAVSARATVGDVLLAVTLGVQVTGQVALITDVSVQLIRSRQTASRYLSLLGRLSDTADEPAAPARSGPGNGRIVLRDVSFTYPGRPEPALRNLDLSIEPGAVIAVVGDNGAGKTTLGKLLCRLYDPASGRIEVDGQDLRGMDVTGWRRQTSAAYQDFIRFELTAGESVGIGDLDHLADEERIRNALERADGRQLLSRLPQGLQTPLGASFGDGQELSAGQWQRLAVGRALMRRTPTVVIFDEPTASLDPETEAELFQRYAAAAAERRGEGVGAVVIITHRLGSVRFADRIVVLREGAIAETGSHEELVAAGGPYALLMQSQAKAYQVNQREESQ